MPPSRISASPDLDPFISPEGSKLYFSSIRPVREEERTDTDICVVSRTGSGWSEPQHNGPVASSGYDELYPSVDANGVLYFASDRPGGFGGWDIYRSRVVDGKRRPARNHGPSSSPGSTSRTASVSATSMPPYERAARQPRANLGARVNSELDEYHPSLSPDGKVLFFVRHSYEPWVPGDIYRIPLRAVRHPMLPGE